MAAKARKILHDVFDHQEDWVKIHAAEALVAGYSRAALQSGVALVIMLGIMVWQAGRSSLTADEDIA